VSKARTGASTLWRQVKNKLGENRIKRNTLKVTQWNFRTLLNKKCSKKSKGQTALGSKCSKNTTLTLLPCVELDLALSGSSVDDSCTFFVVEEETKQKRS